MGRRAGGWSMEGDCEIIQRSGFAMEGDCEIIHCTGFAGLLRI